jgi:hypothetical protein
LHIGKKIKGKRKREKGKEKVKGKRFKWRQENYFYMKAGEYE